MTTRTKIAIIGADSSAFHIFNTIYRSDDRYEIVFFVNLNYTSNIYQTQLNIYPYPLSGPSYPSGIPILPGNPFQSRLQDKGIEKCVFSSICVTSSSYLYLTAQCLAAGCSVISHNLESTRLSPPKALVSFFADTQFDGNVLMKILSVYREAKLKPAVIFPASVQAFGKTDKIPPCITIKNRQEFDKENYKMGDHLRDICEQLVIQKYPIYFVFDFEAFAAESMRDDSYDLIVFYGFNSLPCFFQSHLVVYACDDFTFGDEIAQHPSSILCQQADFILFAQMTSQTAYESLTKFTQTKIIPIDVGFSAKNQEFYGDRPCLLLDDCYPTQHCSAVRSISKFLAEHFGMKPIYVENEEPPLVGKSPIYYEPTEKHWPALIVPDNTPELTNLVENVILNTENYDVIVSSTEKDISKRINVQNKFIMQFVFDVKLSPITIDLLSLPPGAFVRQRRR